ncbi:hypothetical protein BJ875DRAFT_288746 [Amylocarpus encephaloides]|uniref:DUF3835 domain-containing protein n=1 Tax=Amylocarpus encephaloides TaxID=45428 RepID=A0A9P8C5T4_9HELO|nr:hypothetical protein BJ875DRAFT_288746 [Amylocarpus encephaloides]
MSNVDPVEQNVRISQKQQLEAAENKMAASTVISTPEVENDESLPLTEIIEELDEDENIIATKTSTLGDAKPQLLEVLQKAGFSIPESASTSSRTVEPSPVPAASSPAKVIESPEKPFPTSAPVRSKPARKAVGFSSDTKPGPDEGKTATAQKIEDIMALAKRSEKSSEQPIIPTNESPEDAALRKQMLQYGLSEVGQIVAELQLEEGSDWSDDEFDDDGETSDEEDKYGRSIKPVVDERLHQRMRELEAQLSIKVMGNIGKPASDLETPVTEGIRRVTINGVETTSPDPTPATDNTGPQKAVRFSEDLDISPSVNPATSTPPPSNPPPPVTNVIERSVPESQPRTVPSGPAGRTLAPQVIERESPPNPSAAEPDELDPQLLHQEVAVEYHKARNRMIQRQGGFAKEEESEIVPFTEEEGGPKKMSRFKAARLAKMGL